MADVEIVSQDQSGEPGSPTLIDGHVCFFLPLQYISGESTNEINISPELNDEEGADTQDQDSEETADTNAEGGDISEEDKSEIAVANMKVFETLEFLKGLKTEKVAAKPPTAQFPKEPRVIAKQRLIRDLQFCSVNSLEDPESNPEWSEGGDISGPGTEDVKACYDNIGIFLDFMAEVFNRDSIDNRGCKVTASVNYEFNYPNAFYSSALGQVIFGTGFPMKGWMENDIVPVDDFIGITGNFVTGIDIVAHELMHAITQCTVAEGNGLEYIGESGALAESIADVFGIMTQQWHSFKTDPSWTLKDSDWIVGKTAILPGYPNMGLRSLKDPGRAFRVATKTKILNDLQIQDYLEIGEDVEVHIASGVPNKAFYEAVKEIGGLPWEKAGQVWYRALTSPSLKSNSSLSYFANITFKEAVKLGKEIGDLDLGKKVQRAWRKVNVRYDTWDDE
ncbi:hypothetical protein TWF281_011568 [Arthrobotrys megalospora]